MIPRDPPRRQGPDASAPSGAGLAEVADVLLSAPGPLPPPEAGARPGRAPTDPPVPEAAPPRGLYVLVPAGVDPSARREAALSAAGRLATRRRLAGVLLFQGGRVEAHVLGEPAGGRLGPQNYPGGADLAQTVRRLAEACNPIALVPLDSPEAVLDPAHAPVERPVFVAEPDAEGLVEVYRALKAWRRRGAAGRSAILFAGSRRPDADPLHARLRQAVRAFLECDLARQRTVAAEAGPRGTSGTDGVRLFARAPAEAVWPPLLAVAAGTPPRPDKPVGPHRVLPPLDFPSSRRYRTAMVDERPSWDEYFMSIAENVARRSTCLRRQVGAILVVDRQILATGYNGAPSGVPHCAETGCLREQMGVPAGERHELCRGLHAEQNAIIQAAKHGTRIQGATLYTTYHPCSICAKMAINAGVRRIVCRKDYPDDLGKALLGLADVTVEVLPLEA